MAAVLKAELNEKTVAAQAAEEAKLAAQALKAELTEKIAAAEAAEKESLETYKRWKKREAEQQEMLEGAERTAARVVELHVEK